MVDEVIEGRVSDPPLHRIGKPRLIYFLGYVNLSGKALMEKSRADKGYLASLAGWKQTYPTS